MPLIEQSNLFSDYADSDRAKANPTRWQAQETNRPAFDGATFDPVLDHRRLTRISQRIFELMKDGIPRSQSDIRETLGLAPDTAITSRLRDYRKPKFGSHKVFSERREGGVYYYQLIMNEIEQ